MFFAVVAVVVHLFSLLGFLVPVPSSSSSTDAAAGRRRHVDGLSHAPELRGDRVTFAVVVMRGGGAGGEDGDGIADVDSAAAASS